LTEIEQPDSFLCWYQYLRSLTLLSVNQSINQSINPSTFTYRPSRVRIGGALWRLETVRLCVMHLVKQFNFQPTPKSAK